jgi:hypothetical protein
LKKTELIKKENGKEVKAYNLNELYIIQKIPIKDASGTTIEKLAFYPFIGSEKCCLKMKNADESKTYWCYNGTTYEEIVDVAKLNTKSLNALYQLTDDSDDDEDKKELVIEARYKSFIEDYDDGDSEKSFWIKKEGKILLDENSKLATICRNGIEYNKEYSQYLSRWGVLDNYSNLATPNWDNEDEDDDNDIPQEITDRITYVKENVNGDYLENHWNISVSENPDQLIFWFDFLETEGSDLYKYSVRNIGSRTKSINDSNVKSIYYRDVPNVIFVDSLKDSTYTKKSGYTYI